MRKVKKKYKVWMRKHCSVSMYIPFPTPATMFFGDDKNQGENEIDVEGLKK